MIIKILRRFNLPITFFLFGMLSAVITSTGLASTMSPVGTTPDISVPMTATPGNVTLDYIYKSTSRDLSTGVISNDGNNLLLKGPYDATGAVGVYVDWNDDKGGVSDPNPNIGQYEDGILNGEKIKVGQEDKRILTGMEFIREEDLQDVDQNGYINDPGWIHLANYQQGGTTTYDTIGGDPDLYLSDLLTFTLEWSSEFTIGWWELAVDPVKMAELIAAPDSGIFDHLAISLKTSNSFAVYDFDFIKIFREYESGNNGLDFITAYTLGGTFNTYDFPNPNENNFQDISHINIWARDPVPQQFSNVPEPATMLLFGFGLLGLAGVSRRKNKG